MNKDRAARQHGCKRKVLDKAYVIALLGDRPYARAHDRLAHASLFFALSHKECEDDKHTARAGNALAACDEVKQKRRRSLCR